MGLIRLFLALSVIVSHNGIRVPGVEGHLAVLSFFIISGFYMGLVLNEKYVDNVKSFYLSRFLRLWPSYIVVFVILISFIEPVSHSIYVNLTATILVWMSSLFMIFSQLLWWFGINGSGALVFLNKHAQDMNITALTNASHMQHMWSVGVEICFYVVAPLFARKYKTILMLMLVFTCVYVLIKEFLFFHHPLDHRSAISSFWLFLLGMTSYFIWSKFRSKLDCITLAPWVASISGVVIITSLIALVQTDFNNPFLNIICFSFFALSIVPIFHYTRKSKIDRALGEMSYPIYLTHWPIVAYLITDHRGSWGWSLVIALISIFCSLVLYVIVDRNVEKYRATLSNNKFKEIKAGS